MFGLFKRRKWISETVAEMRGTYRDLHVRVRNVPCLREEQGVDRKYPYPNFGFEFLHELHEQLGRIDAIAAQLNTGAPANALITLQSYPPISVELRGKPDRKMNQFQSDIADALLEAFKSVDLRPS
ncbi:MAG: hypothetical protein KF771_12270 [Burkholderiales bacterium]|nr:hypothetical protein [Burkholderiales bacterium]